MRPKPQKLAKRARFEILQKKSNNMPRVVCVEKSKHGLRFEIRPSYDDVPMTSQCPTDGQSSCRPAERHGIDYFIPQFS